MLQYHIAFILFCNAVFLDGKSSVCHVQVNSCFIAQNDSSVCLLWRSKLLLNLIILSKYQAFNMCLATILKYVLLISIWHFISDNSFWKASEKQAVLFFLTVYITNHSLIKSCWLMLWAILISQHIYFQASRMHLSQHAFSDLSWCLGADTSMIAHMNEPS